MADDVSASGHKISRLERDEGEEEEAYTVVVTGFGPFLDRYPINPSWSVASTLPALLLPPTTSISTSLAATVCHSTVTDATIDTSTSTSTSGSTSSVITAPPPHPLIRVLVHPHPLRVSYPTCATFPSTLHATYTHPRPDAFLHIGLAAGRAHFTAERGARARGYDKFPDVDGGRWGPGCPGYDGGEDGEGGALPAWLGTGFDVDDVVARCRDELAATGKFAGAGESALPDVRASPDAGNYLCGFTYFRSLAWYVREGRRQRRRRMRGAEGGEGAAANGGAANGVVGGAGKEGEERVERPVLFLHVPALPTDEDIAAGREVAVAMIRAMVVSLIEKGTANG